MHFSMAHKTHNALSVDQKEAILLCMENQNLLHVGILMPAKAMVNVVSNNAKLGVFQAYLMICSCFIKLNQFFFLYFPACLVSGGCLNPCNCLFQVVKWLNRSLMSFDSHKICRWLRACLFMVALKTVCC